MGDDQDLLIESDEPRPDLLEWAYWAEISETDARKATPQPEKPAEPVKKTAPRKTAPRKAAEGGDE
ncbi:hypothetical protein [Nocardia farcinica]|uniref:hypothetical protein n=1 Tax=Nocardia farcinica TaxID=37329 RepID=UPI001115767F|nr:hypothetical protein [Nocardia farcinica]MBF6538169.1 hypothetical protein [Nocardia farcinica]